MKRLPSLLRIAQTDYLAQIGILIPVVIWIMALIVALWDRESAAFFRVLAPALTLIGATLFFWRWHVITSTFEDGSRAAGTLVAIQFFRGRGRAIYVYTAAGQKLMTSNAVNNTPQARALRPGQDVTVTYHPLDPKRAFVDELYL